MLKHVERPVPVLCWERSTPFRLQMNLEFWTRFRVGLGYRPGMLIRLEIRAQLAEITLDGHPSVSRGR